MSARPDRPLFSLHVDAERGLSGGEVQVFLLLEGLRARWIYARLVRSVAAISGPVRELGANSGKFVLLVLAALVLPARREGLGVAALQAMAAGRAVIGSAVGGLTEALVERESGLLVPPEEVTGLAAAIEELYKDRALRKRLAAGGRARLAQGYLANQMVAAYDDMYRRVLAGSARA